MVREFRVHRNLADDTTLELKDGETARLKTVPYINPSGLKMAKAESIKT